MRVFTLICCLVLFGCSNSEDASNKPLSELNNSREILFVSVGVDGLDVQEAIEQAKHLLAENKTVTLEFSEGIYHLDSPIILSADFSGTGQNPFVIKASTGAKVVFSAGEQLKLRWKAHEGKVYKASLSTQRFDQLFVNDERQIRARYPNFDSASSVFNGFAANAIALERIAHWENPEGGFVHALHEGRWGGMHYEIIGRDDDGEVLLEGGYQNNRYSEMHEKYRYVENIFEELDAPGEWFYDETVGELFFYPPEGMDLSSASVVVSRLDHLIEIRGTQYQPVQHIDVRGLEFTHTNQTFMKTDEPLLRSDWAVYRGGAVVIEGAENIAVTDNKFHLLGGNAVFVSNYNRDITVSGNHIHGIGASAVSFVGDADAVRSPSFEYNEFISIDKMDFEPGPKTDNYPSNSTVSDNLIHDIGLVEKQVAGVQVSMASDITISHNSIYRVPRAGINVSEGTWGGHIIEYNDVFDTVLETGDHGAFNSWGRDRFWHPDRAVMDEIAKQNPGMWELDAQTPTIIRNNRFQCDHGWDIDLDDGSSNYEIYNNVALNGGIKLREGFHRIVENNIVINNAFHPHVWFENSGDVFRQNLVTASHKPILNDHWGSEVDENVFTNQKALNKAQTLGLDTNSIVVEPKFVNSEQGDYRLSEGSAAFTVGFKNFSMDQFGVVSSDLKAKAEQPDFPKLFLASADDELGRQLEILGATFKTVETLGEQSALGAPEIAGAMVLSVVPESIADQGGLMPRDLILEVLDTQFNGRDEIGDINDLLNAYQSRKWRGVLELKILRNQQPLGLSINLII